jgi:hypothetical protein
VPTGHRPRRYRCNACGNLTRFTVTSTRRTRSFHHFTLGGDLTVEDEELLEETVEDVVCRWCGTGASVVEVSDSDADAALAAESAEAAADARAEGELA